MRTRLTAVISALVLVALASAGAMLWLIGNVLIDQRLTQFADQELEEFTTLREIGIDPDTGAPLDSVPALTRLYLQRNVPSSSELLVGYWNDRVQVSSAGERRALLRSADFIAAVQDRLDTGGQTTLDSEWGRVHLDVLPVRDPRIDDGAFVVALFASDEQDDLRELVRTYAVVAGLALVMVTVVAYVLTGRLLSPLRALRETAVEISETDLSRRIPERGNDDLTELTRTVNDMLGRLQHAFAGQREFLDDAGHELRTPLTILQGHLEVLDPEDSGEVRRTRDLVLDEVGRMSRLVDDLILLTKADRPGFLRFSTVDVATLTASLREKASVMADRRWESDARAEVRAEVDEQRLTQAMLQLLQNAVKHTRDGGVVAVGSSYDAARDVVRLWVRDDGPGVPPAERDRIFERFAQIDGRGADGFGLGLSIVATIVHGHGGRVWVDDDDGGGGARFTIEVPRERSTRPWLAS